MPIYNERQRPGNSITGIAQQISLKLDGTWKINRWDGNGWVATPVQTEYEVEIPIRIITASGGTGSVPVVEYDLAGYSSDMAYTKYQINIISSFEEYAEKIRRITKVHLSGSSSDFTQVDLGG